MTAEEAIRSLRFLTSFEEMPKYPREVFEMAIEALEKTIAKKPVKKNPICYSKTMQGEEHYAYDFHCVQCGAKINGEGHHCSCGQAIDWSDK